MEKKNVVRPLSNAVEFWEGHNNACTCIDWLQLNFNGHFQNSAIYGTKALQIKPPNWNGIYEIFKGHFRQATVVNNPTADFIDPLTNLFKLDNRECYWNNPVNRLIHIAESCNTKLYQASRIDIAVDFNTFYNGLLPNTFISNFFQSKYLKKGHKKFMCVGDSKKGFIFEYLRFSNKKSNISAYLYNKSKEMRDVKKKNYIIKHWEACGLDTTKDIWRLEFSIHLPKFQLIDKKTGHILEFNPILLDNKEYLVELIKVLISKYWCFVYPTNTEIKNCKKEVKLFSDISGNYTLDARDNTPDTNRADLIFLNKLRSVNDELRRLKRAESDSAKQLINYYKKTRNI